MNRAERALPLPPTLIGLSARGGGPSVVFCPDVGGNVIYARQLVRALGAGPSSYGLRLAPEMIETLDALTLQSAARRFAADLMAADLPRPLHVVGFSFAGYMAAETAQQLSLLGQPPDRLWILDLTARRELSLRSLLSVLRSRFAANRGQVLHRQGFIRIDLAGHPEGYRRILTRLYTLFSRYRPGRWAGRATVVVARDGAGRKAAPDLGWGRYIAEVDCVAVPGDHLGMMHDAGHVTALAARFLDQFRKDAAATP